jgi:GrpB-like predicted nucleotidyltransferase (UPF0157 family)
MSSAPEGTGSNLISDEELQKISIGERTPHNAPIALVEYDPSWPRLFAREAERIRVVLGDTARCIEHVGSTSVPGLAAKPIIDILLIVANSADEPSYVPQLEAAGYVLRIREPEWFEHRLFKGPDTNINLHVFSVGAAEIDRMLRFRDWLRATDADRVYRAKTRYRPLTRCFRGGLGCSSVLVDDSAEDLLPPDWGVEGDHGVWLVAGRVLVEALVWSVFVEVAYVLVEDGAGVSLVVDQ